MVKIKVKNLKHSRNVSRLEAEQFLELYNQIGCYKEVAKLTGRCVDSVSKWVKILQAEQVLRLPIQTQ